MRIAGVILCAVFVGTLIFRLGVIWGRANRGIWIVRVSGGEVYRQRREWLRN